MRTLNQVKKDMDALLREASEIIDSSENPTLRWRMRIYYLQLKEEAKNFFINCRHDLKDADKISKLGTNWVK